MKNKHAQALGRLTSEKKKLSSKENGKKGGYWKQARNQGKSRTQTVYISQEGLSTDVVDTSKR